MSEVPDRVALAKKVADSVLFEGYLLYPYHQAAQKNQARFQFGVLMPPAYDGVDPSEHHVSQTECLLEATTAAQVRIQVRFLQLLRRKIVSFAAGQANPREVSTLVVDGTEYTQWDEAIERTEFVTAQVPELLDGDVSVPVHVPAGSATQDIIGQGGQLAGQVVRSWSALDGMITARAHLVAGPYGALRLGIKTENRTAMPVAPQNRNDGLGSAFLSAHTLIWVPDGSFLSMTDPPEWAAAEVAACENIGTWPVLAGPAGHDDLMLSSPVILYDHAEVAPESAGDLFDATEIDEILTLRTLALTESEKRAARSTDPRAADLIDRLDGMPPEMLDRLHGAIRYLRSAPSAVATQPVPAEPARAELRPDVPWWDPGSDASVSPETDLVLIGEVPVGRGSRVRMRPGTRRADAQDLFLAGREAIVEAVLHDVDGKVHVAVSPADDPAADLRGSHGRFLYFGTDEIEPLAGGDGEEQGNAGLTRQGRMPP